MTTPSPKAKGVVLTLLATTMIVSVAGVAPAAPKKKTTKKKAATTTTIAATTTTAKPAATTATTAAPTTTEAPKAAAPTGKIGDQLTIAIAAAPNSLNPALANVGTANLAINPLYASLLYMKPDRTYASDVAEKWGYTDAFNEVFELSIRSGIKFADGTPLDANAVAASLNYYLKNGLNRSAWLPAVTSITASGSKVTIKAGAPTPDLERILSSDKLAGAIISPAGLADPSKMATASYGAGAYTLDASGTTPGSQYTMVPNKNYWDATQQRWKKVVIKVVPDANAVIQAMQTGQIDFTTQFAGTNLAAAKAAGLNIDTAAGASFFALLPDRGGELTGAIADVKVRQAMNLALDRPAICKAVFGDAAIPMYQLQAKGMDGYDPELDKLYPFDVAKAKALMAQSSAPNGFKLSMEAANQAGFNVLGQAVAQQWKAIGIDVELTNSPNVPAGQALHAAKKFSSYITANGLNSTPLLAGLHIFSPGNRYNPWGSTDPGINDILKQGFAQPGAEGEKLYRKAWRRYMEQAWAAPVCTSLGIVATTKAIGGWKVPDGGNLPSAMDLFPA
jgi:peptide/nickel transport system substrate-binding protein